MTTTTTTTMATKATETEAETASRTATATASGAIVTPMRPGKRGMEIETKDNEIVDAIEACHGLDWTLVLAAHDGVTALASYLATRSNVASKLDDAVDAMVVFPLFAETARATLFTPNGASLASATERLNALSRAITTMAGAVPGYSGRIGGPKAKARDYLGQAAKVVAHIASQGAGTAVPA